MGRAARWLRRLLGRSNPHAEPAPGTEKVKKWWLFGRSSRGRERKGSFRQELPSSTLLVEGAEQRKQAFAVAAAAAEAAITAAAEVMRLTRRGRAMHVTGPFAGGGSLWREELAAVKIQAAFRGYLGRRALRALRGLVRLQAMVRGHIERKRVAEMLRRMPALVQVQARAGAGCTPASWPENRLAVAKGLLAQHSASSITSWQRRATREKHYEAVIGTGSARNLSIHLGPATPEKYETVVRTSSARYYSPHSLKRSDPKSRKNEIGMDPTGGSRTWLDQWVDRIADQQEVQSTEPRRTQLSTPNTSSIGIQSMDVDGSAFRSADTSPQISSFTPSMSDNHSVRLCSGRHNHASYMAGTESSRAKARSQSSPRQRPELGKSASRKRVAGDGRGARMATVASAEKAHSQRNSSTSGSSLHAKVTSKARAGVRPVGLRG